MHHIRCVATIKDIKTLQTVQLTLFENIGKRSFGAHDANGVNFEKLLNSSLKQLYNDGIKINSMGTDNTPVASNTVRKAEIDDNAKFKTALKTVFKHEGAGLVIEDGGRESSKYGVIESTARTYGFKGEIKHLSKANAEAIYKKIWDKSGAGSLPYPLCVIHFDTYVNSPSMAKKILQQSDGNIDTYLKMRMQRYTKLAQLRPERFAKYLKGWTNRVNNLKTIASNYSNPYNSMPTRS